MLSYLQAKSNNVVQISTGYVSNKLAYNFKINNAVRLLADLLAKQYSCLRQIKREDAEAAMAFANTISKTRYNKAYCALNIKSGFIVYFCLYQEYIILDLSNRKLSNQRVGLFRVIEAVGKRKQI